MKRGLDVGKKEGVAPIKKMIGPMAPKKNGHVHSTYELRHLILIALWSFVLGMFATKYGPALGKQFGGELTRLSSSVASPRAM